MYSHDTYIRVRYGETDQMGYVYYGNYAQYFEVGRVELIRSLGISYKDLEATHRIGLPVASMQVRFLRPAKYDDLLLVRTALRELPGNFITFHSDIIADNKKLICSGVVKLCFYDITADKTILTPSFLIDALQPFFIV